MKGSLLADQEVMELIGKLLIEKTAEIDNFKTNLGKVQTERDNAQEHYNKLSRDYLVLKTDVERERQLTVAARNLMSKNNNRLLLAQTDSQLDRVGAEDSPIPIPENRHTNKELRRETIRIVKVIKKLRDQLNSLTRDKEEQDKITSQLQEEADKLKLGVGELTTARIIAEKERMTLQKQANSAEAFANDLIFQHDQAKRLAIDLQREIDITKDRISTYAEKNSQLEKSKDKYEKIERDLERQVQFAVERRKVVAEEKADLDFNHKRLRRQYLEESSECRIALEELARLDEKLQAARSELAAKRALYTQEERDRENIGQELFHYHALRTASIPGSCGTRKASHRKTN